MRDKEIALALLAEIQERSREFDSEEDILDCVENLRDLVNQYIK
jgi:hypothetical protein